jgi:hypothetical protein
MSDVTLETLNRRANIAAIHAEAARVGADPERLLDSRGFYNQVTALDPDAPGYHVRVRELVASATVQHQPPPPQSPAPEERRQWTLEDVDKSTPEECVAAGKAGLLRDLGYAPPRSRR